MQLDALPFAGAYSNDVEPKLMTKTDADSRKLSSGRGGFHTSAISSVILEVVVAIVEPTPSGAHGI
jgi:hypothetical protein